MAKPRKTLLKPIGLVLIMGLIAALTLIWMSQSGPSEHRRQTLITRLQSVQKLQVLEARLLAHEVHRNPALLNTNEFLIVARGKAVYGIDLAAARIQMANSNINIALPPVQLQELIVNPEDLEFLGAKKGLLTSQQDFEILKRQAAVGLRRELSRQARDPDLIGQAESNARAYLETLLKSLGYAEAEIRFEKQMPSKAQL